MGYNAEQVATGHYAEQLQPPDTGMSAGEEIAVEKRINERAAEIEAAHFETPERLCTHLIDTIGEYLDPEQLARTKRKDLTTHHRAERALQALIKGDCKAFMGELHIAAQVHAKQQAELEYELGNLTLPFDDED